MHIVFPWDILNAACQGEVSDYNYYTFCSYYILMKSEERKKSNCKHESQH